MLYHYLGGLGRSPIIPDANTGTVLTLAPTDRPTGLGDTHRPESRHESRCSRSTDRELSRRGYFTWILCKFATETAVRSSPMSYSYRAKVRGCLQLGADSLSPTAQPRPGAAEATSAFFPSNGIILQLTLRAKTALYETIRLTQLHSRERLSCWSSTDASTWLLHVSGCCFGLFLFSLLSTRLLRTTAHITQAHRGLLDEFRPKDDSDWLARPASTIMIGSMGLSISGGESWFPDPSVRWRRRNMTGQRSVRVRGLSATQRAKINEKPV